MRKLFFIPAYILFIITTLSSCNLFCEKGTGNPISEQRNISEFNEIELDGQAIVYIEQGNEAKLEVEIDSNLLQFVKTTISGTKLKIYDDKCLEDVSNYEIHIRVPELKSLNVGGSVNVKSEGKFTNNNLYIKVQDAANVRFGVDVEELEVVIEDSGNLNLSGKSIDFDIEVDNSGLLDAYGLMSKNVDADVSDAGVCKIKVSGKFSGDASDNGKISYKGNPKKVKTNISDSGSIKAK